MAWKVWGQEGGKVKQKMMKYVTKQERTTARSMRDLSYTPKKTE